MMLFGAIAAVKNGGRSMLVKPQGVVGLRSIQVYKNFTNSHSIADKDDSKMGSHLHSILEGNKKWVEARKAEDPAFFDKLAKPQTPKYLYFGCSDSRVPANQILGKG